MREWEDASRTRAAGNRDEVEGVVANTLNAFRNGASLLANAFGVGFIDWLGSSELTVFNVDSLHFTVLMRNSRIDDRIPTG